MVGLSGRGDDRIRGYSKGMTQRIGLAQAIIHAPDLVLLDEPTSALDPVGRREVRDLIRSLRDRGHDGVPELAPAERGRDGVRSGGDRRPRPGGALPGG